MSLLPDEAELASDAGDGIGLLDGQRCGEVLEGTNT